MSLVEFKASGGDLPFLWEAYSSAKTALVHGHNLDVRMTGAVITVAAGYVLKTKASLQIDTTICNLQACSSERAFAQK